MGLTKTPSKEVAQMLKSVTSKRGLNRERRASQLWTGPCPHQRQRGRQAIARARRRGDNLSPREGILNQTASGLPAANQVFLGYWMVDTHQEDHGQRSAHQRRHTSHLGQHSWCAHRKLRGWDQGGDKTHHPPGETALAKHLVAWAARTWEGHKMQAQPSLYLCGVPENLNLSSLDLGSAHNPGPALDSSPAEQPGAWAV